MSIDRAALVAGSIRLASGIHFLVDPLGANRLWGDPEEPTPTARLLLRSMGYRDALIGGLLATAVLPSVAGVTGTTYLHPAQLAAGFRTAVLIAACMSAAGGVLAAFTIRNRPRPARPGAEPGIPEAGIPEAGVPETRAPQAAAPAAAECLHCGLDAPPLRTE